MAQRLAFWAAIATAITIPAPAFGQSCGNGVREGAEQCDDGNRASFDGCSARCTFEQVHRFNQLKLQFAADAACPANALGPAFGANAQASIQTAIDSGIMDGSMSTLLYFIGLDDLSGQADPDLQIGLFNATPRQFDPGYDGSNDLDWWYLIDELDLLPPQQPAHLVGASISAGVLSAGPGTYALPTNLGGILASLSMRSLKITAATGGVSTPLAWPGDSDRGHLPGENLDPALQSFSLTGNSGGSAIGAMCGNTTAGSLAASPIPASLASYCANYDISHSMLDLIVGGCTYLNFLPIVKATQPDQGGGDVYKFFENSSHFITSCTKNAVAEALENCLASAAYSTVFRFSTDRVVAQSANSTNFIFYDGFE